MKSIIKEIIEKKPITLIKPKEFFIAWQGVPTLAFEGFTETLLTLKQDLSTKIPGIKD